MSKPTTTVLTGSRGIALEVAKLILSERISDKVVFLSRTPPQLPPTSSFAHLPLNLAHPHSTEFIHTCKLLENWPDPIRCLVNCAGTLGREKLWVMNNDPHNLEEVMNINLVGPMQLTKSVVKHMLRHPLVLNKSIVNVSSVVASTGNAGQTVYGASKSGLNGFTKSLSKELGSRNIRVNSVAPGFALTQLTAHLHHNTEEVLKRVGGNSLNRFAQPEEIAHVIAFLCSSRASYVTGQVWKVDGGM